jgi:ABC-2 type transport system ATP-binding protein
VCKCDPYADRPAVYNPAVTTPVVEIEKLSRRFGTFTAVDSLTLVANAGEVFGLLGSNGAGKSTTIKMLTTLLPPSSGEARVGGFSITTQPVEVRRAIGYVPQAVSVDGSLTGYENLLIFAKLYDIPRSEQQARIREQLTFVDLTADAGRLVGQYSGGMVRRLEIAQATLHRPRVLFLDEPTVGLDPICPRRSLETPDRSARPIRHHPVPDHTLPGGRREPLRSHRDHAHGAS